MTFIDQAEDNTWPNGVVYKVVRALNLKYKPTDIMSKTEMRMAISEIKMKNNEDPTTLFTQMSTIEVKYCQTISVKEKLAIIMQHIPKDYKSLVTAAIRSTELSTTTVTTCTAAAWQRHPTTGLPVVKIPKLPRGNKGRETASSLVTRYYCCAFFFRCRRCDSQLFTPNLK